MFISFCKKTQPLNDVIGSFILFFGILFEVFMEWPVKGKVQPNGLLGSALILLLLTLIPDLYWTWWLGLFTPWFVDLLRIGELHLLLSAVSGLLLVRSLTR